MKKFMIAVALFVPAAVAAAPSGPIGYTKLAGSAHELFLVHRDGSNPVRVYRTPNKTGIGFFDIKPGGGQIAFGHTKGGLYILTHDANGIAAPLPPAVDPSCYIEGMDWSADGTAILYSRACSGVGEIRVHQVMNGANTLLLNVGLTSVRWGPDNSIFYLKPVGSGRHLMWRRLSSPICEATLFESTVGFATFDVSRQGDAIILADSQALIRRVPVPAALPLDCVLPRPVATKVGDGTEVHFSPDGSEFLYKTPHAAKGDYLRVQKAVGFDTISPKGEYIRTDWDPLAPAAPTATDFAIREAP